MVGERRTEIVRAVEEAEPGLPGLMVSGVEGMICGCVRGAFMFTFLTGWSYMPENGRKVSRKS